MTDTYNSKTFEVESGKFIKDANASREGQDLVLTAPDGQTVVIEDYFVSEPRPNIVSPEGDMLTPNLVNSFLKAAPVYASNATMSDESPVGAISELSGDATITRVDGSVVEVNVGTPVYQGDIVETAGEGSLNIVFIDETNFSISRNARLAIDEYVYDAENHDSTAEVSILKGLFAYTSGMIGKKDPGDVDINTPKGSIGIRGTIIAGDADSGEVTLIEGEIVLRTHSGYEMRLTEGFETAQFDSGTGSINHVGQLDLGGIEARYASIQQVAPYFDHAVKNPENHGNRHMQDSNDRTNDAPEAQENKADGEKSSGNETGEKATGEQVAPKATEEAGEKQNTEESKEKADGENKESSEKAESAKESSLKSDSMSKANDSSDSSDNAGKSAGRASLGDSGDSGDQGAVAESVAPRGFLNNPFKGEPNFLIRSKLKDINDQDRKPLVDDDSKDDALAVGNNDGDVPTDTTAPVWKTLSNIFATEPDASSEKVKVFADDGRRSPVTYELTENDVQWVTGVSESGTLQFDSEVIKSSLSDIRTLETDITVKATDSAGNSSEQDFSVHIGNFINELEGSTRSISDGVKDAKSLGDVNGDGKSDYGILNSNNVLKIYDGNTDGIIHSISGVSSFEALGDVNGNGRSNFVYTNDTQGDFHSYLASLTENQGDAIWSPSIIHGSGSYSNVISIGDVNIDGYADFAFVSNNQPYDTYHYNYGNSNSFDTNEYSGFLLSLQIASHPTHISSGDFNNRSIDEVFVWNQAEGKIHMLDAESGHKSSREISLESDNVKFFSAMDFNADGKDDLVVQDGNTVSLVLGHDDFTNGNISDLANFTISPDQEGIIITDIGNIGDFNGDGYDDIAVVTQKDIANTAYNENTVFIVYGNDDPTRHYSYSDLLDTDNAYRILWDGIHANGNISVAGLGDLNGDGRDDILVSDSNEYFKLLGRDDTQLTTTQAEENGDSVVGTAEDDTISDNDFGELSIKAGAGNDRIEVSSKWVNDSHGNNHRLIDGGEGFDTLKLDDSRSLDLTQVAHIRSIEQIDLGNGVDNTIDISGERSLAKVLELSDSYETIISNDTGQSFKGYVLRIDSMDGDDDTVVLNSNFQDTEETVTEGENTFSIYQYNNHLLLIDNDATIQSSQI